MKLKDFARAIANPVLAAALSLCKRICQTKGVTIFKNIRGGRSISFIGEDMENAVFEMVKEVGKNPKQEYFKADVLDILDKHYQSIRFNNLSDKI